MALNNANGVPRDLAVEKFNLAEFFGNDRSFKVPSYQREYAWGEGQIQTLCEDLLEFYNSDESYYLLGQVITANNTDKDGAQYHHAVVDGQQRLTSLYLLLLGLRHSLATQDRADSSEVSSSDEMHAINLSLAVIDKATGQKRIRLKLTELGDVRLQQLFEKQTLSPADINGTQKNIRLNFDFIQLFLGKNFLDARSLRDFAHKVIYRVFIIETRLTSEEQALDIFEKLNSRGIPLNSADLLKNLLFQHASENDYASLSATWGNAVENVFKVRPNKAASMEFMMKGMLGAKTGIGFGKRDVYLGWKLKFKENEVSLEDFGVDLRETAKYLSQVSSLKQTHFNSHLSGSRHFGTVQHLPLMIAGRAFAKNTHAQQVFCRIVDARVTMYLLSEEKTQTFEALVWPWAHRIYNLGANPSLESIFAASKGAFANQDTLLSQGLVHFQNYSYANSRDQKRIRYVLAVLSRLMEIEAQDAGKESTPQEYLKKKNGHVGYHLDHILPQSSVASDDEDEANFTGWVHAPGNLTLLHATDNMAAGASKPFEKSKDYSSSRLLFTRALAVEGDLGGLNQRLTKTVKKFRDEGLPDVSNWDEQAVRQRTDFMWEKFSQSLRLEALESINQVPLSPNP